MKLTTTQKTIIGIALFLIVSFGGFAITSLSYEEKCESIGLNYEFMYLGCYDIIDGEWIQYGLKKINGEYVKYRYEK